MHAENLGRILLDKTRNSGAENYGILIRLSADWMGKVDYESEIFLIQRYITLWKGTTASVDIISLSSKLFHDSCFKPAERRKYFFRYSVYVGKNSFDLKQVAIISAETCQMVLNLILASICKEKNWGDEKILVIPVTWQISAQPLSGHHRVSVLTCLGIVPCIFPRANQRRGWPPSGPQHGPAVGVPLHAPDSSK